MVISARLLLLLKAQSLQEGRIIKLFRKSRMKGSCLLGAPILECSVKNNVSPCFQPFDLSRNLTQVIGSPAVFSISAKCFLYTFGLGTPWHTTSIVIRLLNGFMRNLFSPAIWQGVPLKRTFLPERSKERILA